MESVGTVWKELFLNFGEDVESLTKFLVLLVMALIAVLLLWLQGRAYLRLSAQGIEVYLPKWTGLGVLGLSTGHWAIRWSEIRKVSLLPGKPVPQLAQKVSGCRLVIETDNRVLRLSPFLWVLHRGVDHRLSWRQISSRPSPDVANLIKASPLIRALQQRGITVADEVGVPKEQRSLGFDLTQHKGMKVQLVLMVCLGLYALIDGLFLGHFKPLESLPITPFVIVALAGGVLVVCLGRRAPLMEAIVVGMFTVGVLVSAVYPGMLRINAMTADAQYVTYTALGDGHFESESEYLPRLDLSTLKVHEYLEQYPEGAEHEFLLQRGVAGFYQLDLKAFYDKTRAFYSNTQ